MEALKQSFKVQVFATDIDSQAIDHGPRRRLSGQHRRRRLAGTAGALFRAGAGRQRLPHPQRHPRHAGLFRAGRDQRPAVLQTRPDQLPQPADLYGRGPAEEAHSPVPLRAEPGRHALPGHLRDRGRVRGPVCRAGPQVEAVSAQGGRSRRAPPGHGQVSPAPDGRWGRPAARRKDARRKQAAAARADRTGAAAAVRPGRRARQRARRHPLPPRPHRPVPGTGPGRGRHEHPEDGPRRVAARADHRPAQSRGAAESRCATRGCGSKPTATSRPSI